jgi:Protease inhibitor Inh
MGARRIAGGIIMALTLAACASEQGPTPPTPLPQSDMTGRWMLSAPNAPACGLEFEGVPGQTQGTINPDGGCPGNFYMSRNWTFTLDTLTLTLADGKNQPLAEFKLSGAQFTGQSTTGTPVTLAR